MPHRARRWVAGNSGVKGYGNGVPPNSPGHEWHLAPSPASTVAACFSRGHAPLIIGPPCPTYQVRYRCADRNLEDQCVSRPSRSSSSASRPETQTRRSKAANLGQAGMRTSHKVSRTNGMMITRPPLLVTTAPERQAAAFTSAASGCKECRKLTARCAWAAAWKIARLSLARTDSHDCR